MEENYYKQKFKKKGWKLVLIPFGIAACIGLVGLAVMLLWNHLLPEILGVSTITFWQAVGLFALCKILFGFGKGNGGAPWKKAAMARKFKNMSPDEREAFRHEMENRMCRWKKRRYDEPEPAVHNRPPAADEEAD